MSAEDICCIIYCIGMIIVMIFQIMGIIDCRREIKSIEEDMERKINGEINDGDIIILN